MSTDELNITRNKKHLEKIREEGEKDGGNQFSSRGHAASGEGSNEQAQGSGTGNPRRAEGREERAGENNGTPQGHGTGIRPAEPTPLDATEGADTDYRKSEERRIETPEEKAERERELTRQRVQRYRDRQREEQAQGQAENATLRSIPPSQKETQPSFNLKLPWQKSHAEKVKLFTNKEAEEELTRMQDIYFRGSGLLDDLLEIVVKDHEPVQIWQVSEEEAEMLATMHLERAKRDEGAARSARKLLEIYDRLYFWMLVYPRMQATGKHVIAHKGFSFR